MASTYSPLKIELMGTGDQSGTWGTTTNTNLGTAIEEAITGSADVAFSSADVTLTLSNSNTSQTARNLRLNLTGTVAAPQNLIVPAIEKQYIINNGLTFAITVKNSSGTGVAVPAGKSTIVFNTGSNVIEAANYFPGIASSGANSDITSLSGLTTPLSVAQGGTGITSLGAGVATWLGTPSSANLASAVTDETGSGALVFATAPTFTTTIDSGATFGAFASSTALTIGSTATGASSTTNIATAALSGAFTKAINIGTGGTTSSTTTINMGSATNGSTIIRGSLAVGSVTSNTTDGAIWASNNITAFASSDIRFKENIRDIPNALEKVDIIGGKLFDWTSQYIESMGGEHSYYMHKSDAGVIAQDVEKAIPELVRTREDGSLAVDYPKLVALAFAAIKELSDKVKVLEDK
jgi:hypothetical protein